ncbi:MAG: insulinase family protein [Phycisphaerales bacterium]|nr:insulinase family protein [Phycisphaerales bacterium]
MRGVALVLTVCVVTQVPSVLAHDETIVGDQEGTQRIGLSNGIELIVVDSQSAFGNRIVRKDEIENDPVQVWLLVRAGSLYEDQNSRGAAGVIEQIIRNGTEHFSRDGIEQILSDGSNGYGIHEGSFTSFDQTVFMASVNWEADDEINSVFMLFRDILDMGFDEIDDARVREGIDQTNAEYEQMCLSNPKIQQEWLPYWMEGTPFGERLPMVSSDQREQLDFDQIRRFGDLFYQPSQAVILVVGDVDSEEVRSKAASLVGSLARGKQEKYIDGRSGIDVSHRGVIDSNPDFESQEAAAVWIVDRDDSMEYRVNDPWSVRAGAYTYEELRELVVERVAGEIVRYRLERFAASNLGSGVSLRLDQVDLWGQLKLMQIGIDDEEGENTSVHEWTRWVRFLVQESDRLHRDGATESEIARARRAVLSRWHRDADEWAKTTNREHMGLIHWLVTTGRPIIGMERWDRLATELMVGVRDDEIDQVLRGLVDPQDASFIALSKEDSIEKHTHLDEKIRWRSSEVLAVVDAAMQDHLEPIRQDWMEDLVGSMNEGVEFCGEVSEISEYPEPGVWEATLSNGVRVLTRKVQDEDNGVYITATIWGDVLLEHIEFEEELRGAMVAWETPTTESRGHMSVLSFMNEHGIDFEVKQEVGSVQLRVQTSIDSYDEAMDLLYGLLNRPMIDESAFVQWQETCCDSEWDVIDQALTKLYPTSSLLRSISTDRIEGEFGLEDAQRVLTQIVRNGQIDIGIAGVIPGDELLERASNVFGTLDDRDRKINAKNLDPVLHNGVTSVRVIEIETTEAKDVGVVVGSLAEPGLGLSELRARILASMIFNQRIREANEGLRVSSQVAISSAVPDRSLFLVRVWCDEHDIDQGVEIVEEMMGVLSRDGVTEEELKQVQDRIHALISKYFDTGEYWSMRMSALASLERDVDDLWKIREGYRELRVQDIHREINAMLDERDRYRVEIVK